MKKFIVKFSLFFICLSLTAFSALEDSAERLPSLQWQQQSLAKNIKLKVEDVLKTVLQPKEYLVDVEVVASSPEEPDFTDEEGGGAGGANAKAKKKEENKEENKLAKDKLEDKVEPLVKFSDEFNVDTPEDFIVFNKFGLEAPLVDDFNDLQPDGKIILAMEDAEGKKREEALKREIEKAEAKANGQKDGGKGPNSGKLLWKLNAATDIFQNLKGVKVFLKVSSNVLLEKRPIVEKYIKAIKFNLGKVKPEINFEYVALGDEPSLMQKILKGLNYLSKFSGIIAVLIGMLLFAVVGKSLIQKFFELNENGKNGMDGAFSMENEAEDEAEDTGGAGGANPNGDGLGAANSLNGVERFVEYFGQAETEAVLLIKKWIQDDSDQARSSLRSLVQQMKNEDLAKVFTHLTESERSIWRKLLEKPLAAHELMVANDYVGNQIVQSIIVPQFIEDPEVFDMLLKLSFQDVAKIVSEKPEASGVLLNSLNSTFVNRVLELCEPSVREKSLQQAMAMGVNDIKEAQGTLKETVSEYVNDTVLRPFNEKIIDLIPEAMPETEGQLFDAFISSNDKHIVIDTLKSYYPASLISKLPVSFLKDTLSLYPLEKKVHMLLSVEESMKERFLDIYAPEGSKAFDMVSLEFETIEGDEARYMKVKSEANHHWKDFVEFTRLKIKKEKKLRSEIDEVLIDWVNLKSEDGQADLKLVS